MDQQINWPLVTKSGTNDFDRQIHYYNYSSKDALGVFPHEGGIELISGKQISKSDDIVIEPWGVAVIESQEN